MNGIFRFEYGGKPVLGLDTGLSAEAFARARLAPLLAAPGYIVSRPAFQKARVEPWRAGGVAELPVNGRPSMVIWGPDFAGRPLNEIITANSDTTKADSNTAHLDTPAPVLKHPEGPTPPSLHPSPFTLHPDQAREAHSSLLKPLAAWVYARSALSEEERVLPPWPGAAFIDEAAETVLFLPEAPVRQVFNSCGDSAWIDGAERWAHPDYSGEEAGVFAAAALLYRALSGSLPYTNSDRDTLRQDIREGVFVPPVLAAPGLREEPAALITAALSPRATLKTVRPALADFGRLIDAGLAGPGRTQTTPEAGGFFRGITTEERSRLEAEREKFLQKREKAVKTRRFLSRNRTLLLGILGAAVIAALAAGSLIRAQLDRPSTRNLKPGQVIETYYNAFNTMDHTVMGACVTGGAGKNDIGMVTNLYVISKVRQAYEAQAAVISPEEWRESGGGPSAKAVFGISDLSLAGIDTDESDGEVSFRAEYLFFNPYPDNDTVTPAGEAADAPPPVPTGIPRVDELVLVKDKKGLWHISGIRR